MDPLRGSVSGSSSGEAASWHGAEVSRSFLTSTREESLISVPRSVVVVSVGRGAAGKWEEGGSALEVLDGTGRLASGGGEEGETEGMEEEVEEEKAGSHLSAVTGEFTLASLVVPFSPVPQSSSGTQSLLTLDFSIRGRDVQGARGLLLAPFFGPSTLEKVSNEWIFCFIDRFAAEEVDLRFTPNVLVTPTLCL